MNSSISSEIMFYISAENDLHAFAENSVAEIISSPTRDRISAYIMLDRITNKSGTFEHLTTLYKLRPGTASVVKEDLEYNKVAVDPHAFALHVREARNHFGLSPANTRRRKVLFFWGHGSGIEMLEEDQAGKSTAKQAELAEFAGVLARETAVQPPLKFDIVAFDACYMAMIETMNELQGVSSFALCSSTLVDAKSFPYKDIVPVLNDIGSTTSALATAEQISRCYDQRYAGMDEGMRFLFICNLQEIGNAMACLNKLGEKLTEVLLDRIWGNAMRDTIRLSGTGIGTDRPESFVHKFIVNLSAGLPAGLPAETGRDIKARLAELRQVVAKAFTKTTLSSNSSFISPNVWTPFAKRHYLAGADAYNRLSGSKGGEGGWAKFWRVYHQ